MKLLKLTMLLLLPAFGWAQEAQPRFVIGTELGADFRKFDPAISRSLNYTAGLTLEYPMGKFSLATGLLYKDYGWQEYWEYTEETSQEVIQEKLYTFYHINDLTSRLAYYSIPLRLQYRLPCNCVYMQAGVHADIASFGEEIHQQYVFRTYMEPETFDFTREENLKPVNFTFELAVGFKLHFNEHWRMFMRPTYRILAAPAKSGSPIWNSQYHQLHMAFGVQRGFF